MIFVKTLLWKFFVYRPSVINKMFSSILFFLTCFVIVEEPNNTMWRLTHEGEVVRNSRVESRVPHSMEMRGDLVPNLGEVNPMSLES